MNSSQKNVLYFYIFRVLQILFPLVYTMFIARHLSKSDFGYIAIAQSIALFCAAIIEYGFNYSGVRDISKNRDNITEISRIFHNINGAKLILFFLAVIVGLFWAKVCQLPISYWAGMILLIIYQGFNLLWYFQGIDRILFATIADLSAKFVFLLLVLLIKPSGAEILYLLGFIQFIFLLLTFIFSLKDLHTPCNKLKDVISLLSAGRNLFIFRIGSLIYGGASTAILGIIMPSKEVAIYGGADRLFRAAAGMTSPIGDAYFANINHALKTDSLEAKKLFLKALKLLFIVTTTIFVSGELLANSIIKIILGDNYFMSIKILRILLLSIPFIGFGTAIFVLYLLPRGYDKYFALATTLAGVWLVLSLLFLVPRLGIEWMAFSIVISEIIICMVGAFAVLYHKGVFK